MLNAWSFRFRIFGAACAAVVGTSVQGQILQVTPPFPTAQDTVTIVYDAAQGNAALVGVAPVYAHTGIITSTSTSPTNWQNVQGTWGQASPNVLMTSLGNNKHRIKYHIPTFYGAPVAGATVQQLAFVFRNTTGSVVGRSSDGSDIYYPIYPANAGLLCAFLAPSEDPTVAPGTSIPLSLASNQSAQWTLTDNGTVVAQSTSAAAAFVHTYTAVAGNHVLVATATGAGGSVARDTLRVFGMPSVQVQNPPAGLLYGINYLNDSTVALKLMAPFKNNVLVLGDFNNFAPDTAYAMRRSVDGKTWWKVLPTLEPGQRYAFQYLIDGSLKIADPYSELILDPSNDGGISVLNNPNPHPYPTGKTTGHATLIHPGKPAYVWKNTQFTPPSKEKLVIYELLVRDFVTTRSYKTILDTLDYLQRLGINAIEFMPTNEFEGNESWGYNPSYQMALDKYYGTPEHFKELIDSCHSRGIAVILDQVFNHVFGQNPLVRMYWDPTAGTTAANSPWFNAVCPHPPYCWGYDFNHNQPEVRDYMDRINTYWLEEYKVDGFRFDYTKGMTNAGNVSNNAQRITYLKRLADTVWAVNPSAYVILEHWADNAEEKQLADYGMMLWGNTCYQFYEGAMGFPTTSNFSWASYKNRTWNQPGLITYLDSHDEERIAFKVKTLGRQSNPNYPVRSLETSMRRLELVSALGHLIPGPKMIYMFTELGYDQSIDNPCRICNKPPRWNYQQVPERKRLYDVTSELLKLKTTYPVFSTANYQIQAGSAGKYLKLTDANSFNALVLGNFDVFSTAINVPFHHVGWWYDYFSGDSIQVTNTATTLSFGPGEYRIYTDQKLATPSVLLGQREPQLAPGVAVKVYPNPVEGGMLFTEVWSNGPVPAAQTLVDVQGRAVRTVDTPRLDGAPLEFPVADLASGIYFLETRVEGVVHRTRVVIP